MKRWDAIAKRCPGGKIMGVEVGVYKGKNARNLLNLLPGLTLFLVDRWAEYNSKEIKNDEASTMGFINQDTWNKIYNKVLKLQRRQGLKRVKIIRKNSIQASKKFKDRSLDFVFIDAGHSFESVKNDIMAWLPKIKSSGFIGGHDYNRSGVKQAIEFMFQHSVIEYDINKTWFVKL
jgi:hypothetical protein